MLLNRKKVRFYARIVASVTAVMMIAFFIPGITSIFTATKPVNTPSNNQAVSKEQAKEDLKAAEDAIKDIQALLEKSPDDKQLLLSLANTYSDAAKYNEAIETYKKYLAIDPGNVDAQVDMGTSYFNNGDMDNAIAAFNKAIETDDTHPTAWYNLAVALSQKSSQVDESEAGKLEADTVKAWEKFVKLAPNDNRVPNIKEEIKSMKQHLQESHNVK